MSFVLSLQVCGNLLELFFYFAPLISLTMVCHTQSSKAASLLSLAMELLDLPLCLAPSASHPEQGLRKLGACGSWLLPERYPDLWKPSC